MRWADLIRLGGIALGAFFSIATSKLPTGVDVNRVTPPHGETAVPLEAEVVFDLYVNDVEMEPEPRFSLVRAGDGARLPTTVDWVDPFLKVEFEPLSPETDYVLVVDDPGWLAEARWREPISDETPMDVPFASFELPFSTRLEPVARLAWRSARYSSNASVRTPMLVVSFSRRMDPESFGPENVAVSAGGQPVPVTIDYLDGDTHMLELLAPTIDETLPATIRLGDGILASDGTPFAPRDVMVP